jgi:hypothetical protein
MATHAFLLTRDRDGKDIFLSVALIMGIALLLLQYRLHPFGYWALIIGAILGAKEMQRRLNWSTLVTTALTLAIAAIALQPALRHKLFLLRPLAISRDYEAAYIAYQRLGDACKEKPGSVITSGNDGHHVRYHTDCSVLINNFLISPFHEQKVVETDKLLRLSPAEFLEQAPHVRYVFARMYAIYDKDESGPTPAPVIEVLKKNPALFGQLIFLEDLPPEYQVIFELNTPDIQDYSFLKIFEIVREE